MPTGWARVRRKKSVFIERTANETAIDDAVAIAREARDITNTNPKLQGTRAWVSPADYHKLRMAATALGIDIAVLLGEIIREYLEGAA